MNAKGWLWILLIPLLAACAPFGECNPRPVVVPTLPAIIPGYTQLDTSTGLHITGTYQEIDVETWRLRIHGKVDTPLELSYDDLRCMPKMKALATIVCRGNFEDSSTWAGVPLTYILDLAGVQADATQIRLIGADGYTSHVQLKDALDEINFLAYEWEGQAVPILHGFPLRAAFPALPGYTWVKWLVEIEVK
jgi:DMSO/TMAO reductase YedYZ molybdopterin-dependent catalytic subunit